MVVPLSAVLYDKTFAFCFMECSLLITKHSKSIMSERQFSLGFSNVLVIFNTYLLFHPSTKGKGQNLAMLNSRVTWFLIYSYYYYCLSDFKLAYAMIQLMETPHRTIFPGYFILFAILSTAFWSCYVGWKNTFTFYPKR